MTQLSTAAFFTFTILFLTWPTYSTGTTSLEVLQEQFLQLKGNYEYMAVKNGQLEDKNAQLEIKVSRLEALEQRNNKIFEELATKIIQLEDKIQKQELPSISRQKDRLDVADLNIVNEIELKAMPTSCVDLRSIGHIWSGLYTVMGVSNVESVYCDFTKLPSDVGFQQWIGFVDVKSVPNYFYVQLNGDWTTPNTPIPFRKELLNVGGGMNGTSGIFTAPVNGKYFFSLSGIVQMVGSPTSPSEPNPRTREFDVDIFKNGIAIGSSLTDEANVSTQFENYSLQSTLDLLNGDQIWLEIRNSSSIGAVYMYNGCHFTGFMLEQTEIATRK